jgi:hypothetical protein
MTITELGLMIVILAMLLSSLPIGFLVIDRRQAKSKSPTLPPMNTRLAEFEAAALERASDKQLQEIKGGNVALLGELVEDIKAEQILDYKGLQKERAELVESKRAAEDDARFWQGLPGIVKGSREFDRACTNIRMHNDAISEVDRQLNP